MPEIDPRDLTRQLSELLERDEECRERDERQEHAREVRDRLGFRTTATGRRVREPYFPGSERAGEYTAEPIPQYIPPYIQLSRFGWDQSVYTDNEPVSTVSNNTFAFQYASGGTLPPPHTTANANTARITIDTGRTEERDDDMPVITDHTVLDRITADLRERHAQVVNGLDDALRSARSVIDHLTQARQYLTENGDPVSTLDAERAKYSARAARETIGSCGRQVTSIPARLTTVARIAADAENERQRIERERAAAVLAENIDALRAAHPGEYIPAAGDELRVPGLSRRTLTVRLLREAANDDRVSFVLDDLTDGNVYTRSLPALRELGMTRASEDALQEPELPEPEEVTPRRGDTVIMPHGISGRPSEESRAYEVQEVTVHADGFTLLTLERNGQHWVRALSLLQSRGMAIQRQPSSLVQVEECSPAILEPGDRFLLRSASSLDGELNRSTVFTVLDSMPWTGDGELRFTDSHYHSSWELTHAELEDYGIIALSGDWLPVEGDVVSFEDAPRNRYVVSALTAPSSHGEPFLSFHHESGEYIYRVDLSRARDMGIRLLS